MKPITTVLVYSQTGSNNGSYAYVGKSFNSPVTLIYVPKGKFKEPPRELKITLEEIKD